MLGGITNTYSRGGVTFTARAHWYAPHRWTIVGVSTPTLPASVTVYVAKRGSHGYWCNAPPTELPGYFGYSDAPALMPLIVGPATQLAIAEFDRSKSVALHIRDGSVETTTTIVGDDNERVIDELVAIHRALDTDYLALLQTWQSIAERLGGSASAAWPPQLTVPGAHGPTTIALRWTDSMAIGSEALIELSAHANGAPLWQLKREPTPTPNCIIFADRPFLVTGDIPFPIDELAQLVARTEILSIVVRRYITVRIARRTPDAGELEALLDLIAALCNAAPYR